MRLFELGEDKMVMLNKPWISLIPEIAELVKRDKGSKGDYRGSYKLQAIREITFIYFFTDFSSPIRDWADEERQKEAMYYAGLETIDEAVWTAQAKYLELQLKASRPLRTLKALYKGMDAMDDYFEAIDFTKTDRQGKLLNDPSSFVTNAGKLNKMYEEIRNFEKRVEDDMKQQDTGIRGPNSSLGDNEAKKKDDWSESDIFDGSNHVAGMKISSKSSFNDILKATRAHASAERTEAMASLPGTDTGNTTDDEEDEDK